MPASSVREGALPWILRKEGYDVVAMGSFTHSPLMRRLAQRMRILAWRGRTVVVYAALGCAFIVGAVLVVYSVLALFPSRSEVGFVASVLLAAVAPFFVLAALIGLGVTMAEHRMKVARLAAMLLVIGMILPLAVCVITPLDVAHAGGSANPVRALRVFSMESAPDFEGPTGKNGQTVQVYRPHSGTVHGLLVDIHGGGWQEDSTMPAVLRSFADAGWVVVRPSYPLASAHRATWKDAPEAVECGYAWAQQHAGDFGTDAENTVLIGDSAGGELAINLAYRIASGEAAHACGSVIPPKAVIGLYPAVSLSALADISALGIQKAAWQYLGGTPADVPDRYRSADSITWISPDAPSTYILRGASDTLVPPASTAAFVAAAQSAGVHVTDVVLPLLNHAFDSTVAGSLGYQATVSIVEHWLNTIR